MISIDANIHKADIEIVEKFINPNYENGPWIAGGAPLRWYRGEAIGDADIDVYCQTQKQARQLLAKIQKESRALNWWSTIRYKTENAVSMKVGLVSDGGAGWNIQIITRRVYDTLEDVLNDFDITVCQVGTDGNKWVATANAINDIETKTLRLNLPIRDGVVKRVQKYWTYGYVPSDEVMDSLDKEEYFDITIPSYGK